MKSRAREKPGLWSTRPRGHSILVAALSVALGALGCDDGPRVVPNEPDVAPNDDGLAPQSRVPRLSHSQWRQTIADLLFLDAADVSDRELRSDPNFGGAIFPRYGELRVDGALWSGYQRSAEAIAAAVATDTTALERLAPPVDDEDARIATFIRDQGRRAYRRALTDEEVAAYTTLFGRGESLYGVDATNGAFASGVRVVVETWLQSPWFLYRPELSVGAQGQRALLSNDEVASRLSFALWGTMPDETLFAAAASGTLQTQAGVREQAERLLADPRAADVINDFHERLFEVEAYARIEPPAFLGTSDDFGAAAAEEHRLFVRDIFTSGQGLEALLTSSETFVNAELAGIYGVEGTFGDAFEKVSLDATKRRGILTQVGFLAKNAAGGAPDPIHRGVFVSKKLVCNTVLAPPDDIPPYPIADGQTNRQQIESLTEREGTNCAECHTTLINPYGFPFENYDAIGRFQTEDNGLPIDPTSLVFLGDAEIQVESALALADEIAASSRVHACYAKSWLEYLYGRERGGDDDKTATAIGELSLDERASLVEILLSIVGSDAFRYRPANEAFEANDASVENEGVTP